jgi:pterin-4a-carbinolamine dehydratase
MSTTQAVPVSVSQPQAKKLTRPRGEKLKAERVQEELKSRGWTFTDNGRELGRSFHFPDVRSASAYAAFVNELAESRRQPLRIALSRGRVDLTLRRRANRAGMTLDVLEFAVALG